MLGSNLGLLRIWHWQSDALTTWLDLIHIRLDLIHTRLDLIQTKLDLINTRLDLIHIITGSVISSLLVKTKSHTKFKGEINKH